MGFSPGVDAVDGAVHARSQRARWQVGLALAGYALLWSGFNGLDVKIPEYMLLHTVMEMAAIVVAMLGAGIVWNAYAKERPGNLVVIGVLLFGTGLLDFAHMLSVPGMPDVVTPADVQKSITFWLAARLLPAIGLMVMAVRAWEPLRSTYTRHVLGIGVLVYVGGVYWAALFHMDQLPVFFVLGQGLTASKVGLEYGLVALYTLAAVLFYRKARDPAQSHLLDLFVAAGIAAISELCFTLYRAHGDVFNLVGHVYKIACYFFIYRAVFVWSVRQPFDALRVALGKEQEQAAEHHSFVRTLDLLDEAVLELDGKGHVVSANTGWWRLAGIMPGPEIELLSHLHPDDRGAFAHQLGGVTSGDKDEFRGRFRFHSLSQAEQWIECHFVGERNAQGGVTAIRGVMRDITKVHLQERHISHMALHDALTSLPNRVLLEDRIRQAIQQASRTGAHVAVSFIDLDHFKDVNDAYGHKTGDALLLALSQSLKGCLREGDTLARWGGDEFVVLLPDLTDTDTVRRVAQKMMESMRQTIQLEGLAINATFSMGVAVYPSDDATGDIDALLAQADRAMFYAKSQGRNNYQLYSEMSSKGLGKKELYIQTRLAKAIHDKQITAYFQPLVGAESLGAGQPRMVGVEVLARWHDPEMGWISPGSFIPMAESLGLISELGTQVRHIAFAHLRNWLQVHPGLTMSINISKRQLFAADFMQTLMADLALYGLEPRMLILEVTESVALMDVAFADDRLRQIAKAGFTLSIDDFGTGYASLSQLHDLPIGELKIDISFVRRIQTEDGLRMVQGIVSLAKALRLTTVAEGVEDAHTAQVLTTLGVDVLQGYHFSRPCPAEEFAALPLFTRSAGVGGTGAHAHRSA